MKGVVEGREKENHKQKEEERQKPAQFSKKAAGKRDYIFLYMYIMPALYIFFFECLASSSHSLKFIKYIHFGTLYGGART